MQEFIRIHPADNVVVALRDFDAGEQIAVDGMCITLCDQIPRGHKIAITQMAENDEVIKYGFPIGHATGAISAGEHVHIHNMATNLGDNPEYEYHPVEKFPTYRRLAEDHFMGYLRRDQSVGVRNELWIVPTVGCVNSIAKLIEKKCQKLVGKGVDAVVAFNHPYGCSQMGEDQENTRKALAALIHHPNAAGVLVLGLGCENCNLEVMKPYLGDYDRERIRLLVCQEQEDEVESAVQIMTELAQLAGTDRRTSQPVSKLVVGMKCGGSDGLSGITANPTVGRFSDYLTANGGTTILTEVPEMFGAETLLMDRAKDRTVYDKTVKLICDFKDYYRRNHQTIYENPSPGNKAGGISSLEDKSLGCTQKSGSSPVVDVLEYTQRVTTPGLNLLSAPGNDLVASTALVLSGATIVLFTTGRGTPFASAVPTVKISTNTPLAQRKKHWIDFDCGVLLQDGVTPDSLGEELYHYVLRVAEGEQVRSEADGIRDLAIFKQGVTL